MDRYNSSVYKAVIIVTLMLQFASCDKPTTNSQSTTAKDSPVPAPFKGEIYRSVDDRVVLTITSPDELEFSENGRNYIFKYTKQPDALRVIVNILGNTEAVYYRITDEGLQAKNGAVLFSPQAYARAKERDANAEKQLLIEQQRIADLIIESKKPTKVLGHYRAYSVPSLKGFFPSGDGDITLTDVEIQNTEGKRIWFGDIVDIRNRSAYESRVEIRGEDRNDFNGPLHYVPFAKEAESENFFQALEAAVNAWKAKFRDVQKK